MQNQSERRQIVRRKLFGFDDRTESSTNRHLLVDNSLTFGGFHYNDPRQIYAQIHYKFGY